MGKILKAGKVVVVLQGKYAGKKAVVIKTMDGGHGARKFPHAIVAGISTYPRKVTRSMSDKKIKKRSAVKPFLKSINFNHVLPTRYQVDLDVKKLIDEEGMEDETVRKTARKELKKMFESRYMAQAEAKSDKTKQGTSYLFKKLRF